MLPSESIVAPSLGAEALSEFRSLAEGARDRISRLSVAVVCGGDTAEREISLLSGHGIHCVLLAEGMQAKLVDWKPGMDVGAIGCDVAFLALHGGAGEDGHIQAALDLAGTPYVSVGMLASAVGMHKPAFKLVIQGLGLRTPRWAVAHDASAAGSVLAQFTHGKALFIKPLAEGSSVGVVRVEPMDAVQLVESSVLDYGSVLVEEQVEGREVTASVLGLRGRQVVLPHIEISPVNSAFYDYRAKYTKGETEYIVPARLSTEESRMFAEAAAKIQDALDLFPYARIDAVFSCGEPYFLEMNTLPGFTPMSLVPQAAAAAGISYGELLRLLIYLAVEARAK